MDFRLNEDQEALQENARNFLREFSGSEQTRAAMESPTGFDAETWRRVSEELGWPSLSIPEAYDGIGLGHVDLAVLFEATGEALLCSPLFATIALAANAIMELATEKQKAKTLPRIADGTNTATLAFTERTGRWDANAIEATATPDGNDFILDGCKRQVVDGHCADTILVVVRRPGSTGEEGISVFALSGEESGLSRTALTTMDQTRRSADVQLDRVRVSQDAVLGTPEQAWGGLRRTLDFAAIALAAEQVGGATRCLDMAVRYSKEREQFGRAIGSFQALKHKCADMFVAVESARSALYYAACIADDGSDDLTTNASLAKAYCSEAYFKCAAESIQIHGGVGFTWEYDPHLHFKRARSGENWLGDPAYHRERIAQAIGL